jgi:hypothetical protein
VRRPTFEDLVAVISQRLGPPQVLTTYNAGRTAKAIWGVDPAHYGRAKITLWMDAWWAGPEDGMALYLESYAGEGNGVGDWNGVGEWNIVGASSENPQGEEVPVETALEQALEWMHARGCVMPTVNGALALQ